MVSQASTAVAGPSLAWRLGFLYAALFLVVGCYLPYLPVWLKWRALDADQIAILLATPLYVRIVFTPAISFAADRLGSRLVRATQDLAGSSRRLGAGEGDVELGCAPWSVGENPLRLHHEDRIELQAFGPVVRHQLHAAALALELLHLGERQAVARKRSVDFPDRGVGNARARLPAPAHAQRDERATSATDDDVDAIAGARDRRGRARAAAGRRRRAGC